jgi:thioredoxin-like negative regulator of GroEL
MPLASRRPIGAIFVPIALLIGACSGPGLSAPASIQAEAIDRQAGAVERDWFRDLNSAEYDTVIKNSRGTYVVLLRNSNCAPCDQMSRSIRSLEPYGGENRPNVGVVDIESNFEIYQKLNIRSVPTTIVYRDGSQVARTSGSMDSRKFSDWIEPYWMG